MPVLKKWLLSLVSNSSFVKFLFFGNYFYGICAVALCMEAMLQQEYPLDIGLFLVAAFLGTVLYYSKAYIMTETPDQLQNQRALWYSQNRTQIVFSQGLFQWSLLALLVYFVLQTWQALIKVSLLEIGLMLLFPFVSVLYYGVNIGKLAKFNLRNVGWLKPFIIGFTWAGLVTVYPVMYHCMKNGLHYPVTLVGVFLFIKNFMFVTVLSIMFDIKDYAMDYNVRLKTFVVSLGLRKTILYIIIPLCILGLASFISYAVLRHFHPLKIALNIIPFILTILVANSLFQRKTIFYYLVIIDGLMLVKALCGMVAMLFFSF